MATMESLVAAAAAHNAATATLTRSAQAAAEEAKAAKAETEQLLGTKQDKLVAGANITIAEDGKTISATGGGADITVDTALSSTSTNPIQNQWLGQRMGATSKNSVQIGYNAKAGSSRGQEIDGSGGDNGNQVAVGYFANGSSSGVAVGCSADGSNYGAAVGRAANGSSYGAAVGRAAISSNYGAAVGYSASSGNYGAAVGYSADGSNGGAAVGREANGSTIGAAVGRYANGSSNGAAVGSYANGSSNGVAVGSDASGDNYGIAIGYYSTTNYTPCTATIGVESSNSVQYSLQISAYNNAQQTFFAQRLIAGETLDDSYVDFYHRDRLSGEIKGRRISATNFFALLDANGATDISVSGSGGGDLSGDFSA